MGLTYALIGDALKVVANFMLKMKICEVAWMIHRTQDSARMPISHGEIMRNPFESSARNETKSID